MIHQLIVSVVNSARITSASPEYVNRVEGYDGVNSDVDFADVIRQEVQRIMDENKQTENVEKSQKDIGTDTEQQGTGKEAKLKSTVLKGIGMAQNPMGAITGVLSKVPIPHVALVALAMSLIPLIISVLTKDGSALDLRWKRLMQKEENSFLDRQTQRNTQIGLRQVIVQSRAGFIQTNGAGGSEDNIRQIREGGVDGNRLARTGLVDHSKGLFGP